MNKTIRQQILAEYNGELEGSPGAVCDIRKEWLEVLLADSRAMEAAESGQPTNDELQKAINYIGLQKQALFDLQKDNAALKSKVEELEREKQTMGEQLDHLLAHCKDSECEVCSKIICPHGEPLHFHHDGCPSCVTFEQMQHSLSQHQAALRECAEELNEAVLFDVVLPSEVITSLNKALSTVQQVLKEK